MELRLTETAKEDIRFFLKSGQRGIVKKIEKLLIITKETPLAVLESLNHSNMNFQANGQGGLMLNTDLFTK